MCNHMSKLGPDYPGLFCIYCGEPVASIKAEDGQILLDNGKTRKYVAVIHKNKQKAVDWIDPDAARPRIGFKGEGKEVELDTSRLITAFQKADEVLSID